MGNFPAICVGLNGNRSRIIATKINNEAPPLRGFLLSEAEFRFQFVLANRPWPGEPADHIMGTSDRVSGRTP